MTRSMQGDYALIRNTLGAQTVVLDNLNRETIRIMLQGPMFNTMGTTPYYEGFNNETGDVEFTAGWNLDGTWHFKDWMESRCRLCGTSIRSAELCASCAEGNDPFTTSTYSAGARGPE